jgi:hypothetical protein
MNAVRHIFGAKRPAAHRPYSQKALCAQWAHNVLSLALKYFTCDNTKNEKLRAERGISFEEVVFHIERGDILDIIEHPNQQRYAGQRIIVLQIADYAYLVRCVEEEDCVVLKTIIPSREAARKYLHGETENDEA